MRIFSALLGLAMLPAAYAIPTAAEWDGHVNFGRDVSEDGGNNVRLSLYNNGTPISHAIRLEWTNQTTGNRYDLSYLPRYSISHSFYYFGKLGTYHSAASGIERETYLLMGAANSPYRGQTTALSINVGAGLRKIELSELVEDSANEFELTAFAGGNLRHEFAELIDLELNLSASIADTVDIVQGEVAISVPLSAAIRVRIGHQIKNYNFAESDRDISSKYNTLNWTYGF